MNLVGSKFIIKKEQGDQDGGSRLSGNQNKKPFLSIITVVYNGEKFLEETISSVLSQQFQDYEYLIIDGKSNDNTIKIIKKYENQIEYWISQKDNGIYDAFNKGLELARGKYVGFINSDDIYRKNTFKLIKEYDESYKKIDFIFGSVKKHWGLLSGYRPWKIYWSWGFYSSHSTGFFIKLDSAKKIGFYNTKYKYSADYDYFYRMIVKLKMLGVASKKNEIFGDFRRGGFSSTINFFDHFCEEIKIRLDNGQNRFMVLLVFIFKFLYHIKKL